MGTKHRGQVYRSTEDRQTGKALSRLPPLPARFRGAFESARQQIEHSGLAKSEEAIPTFAIAWDPELMSDDEYAELVEIMGDLVRANGGAGVRRIIDVDVGVAGAVVCQP